MPSKKSIQFPVRCAYCGVELCAGRHTWDHIVPRFLGGKSEPGNLAHCCGTCNAKKAAKHLHDFLAENPHLSKPVPGLRASESARKASKTPTVPVIQKSKRQLEAEYMEREADQILVGTLGEFDYEVLTYTPPRGVGVTPTLRKVLQAKGFTVKWLPLLAA